MMKRRSEKRQSALSVLSVVSTDDDNNSLLKVQLYFQGAIAFWGLFRAKTSEIRVELFGVQV